LSTPLDLQAVRHVLLARRSELEAVRESGDEAAKPVELDQQRFGRISRMDALQAQAMSAAGRERRRVEMQRIDAALARLERGEYGQCFDCGEAIDPRRLDADPAVTLCVACAEARQR
jgi:DnaK suppressor protein